MISEQARLHSLPLFVRLAGRAVILAGSGPAAQAKRRMLERAGARIVGPEDEARLAIVAIDDDAEAARCIAGLKARGVLVNATDRPEACDFTLPAIIDRSPVLIAIGTGGASAGLAKALRQRLEVLLPAGLGRLAEALKAARGAIRQRWAESSERRRAIDAALDPGGPLDPLRDLPPDAVGAWLNRADERPEDRLAPLIVDHDDPDMLRLGQARLLGQADRIVHHPDVPAAILDRARADAERIPALFPPAPPYRGLTLWVRYEPVAMNQRPVPSSPTADNLPE